MGRGGPCLVGMCRGRSNSLRCRATAGPSIHVRLNIGPSGVYSGLSGFVFFSQKQLFGCLFRLVLLTYYFTCKKDRCNTQLYTYIQSKDHKLTFLSYAAIDNYITYTKKIKVWVMITIFLADFHNFQAPQTILADTTSSPL
jgi:hypothetical protein